MNDKSADQNETHFVRCLKCHKILKCSRYDTTALLEHIRTDHPEIEIVESNPQSKKSGSPQYDLNVPQATQDDARAAGGRDRPLKSKDSLELMHEKAGKSNSLPEIKICESNSKTGSKNSKYNNDDDDDAKVVYTRRYEMATPSTSPLPQTSRNRQLYRTSIEKWRPANGTIYCPKCSANKRPLIKTHAERFSDNSCGAACVLGCWPFCFLPFLFPIENKEYLYCCSCKTFLGLYDRDHNCIKPNRDYSEADPHSKMSQNIVEMNNSRPY